MRIISPWVPSGYSSADLSVSAHSSHLLLRLMHNKQDPLGSETGVFSNELDEANENSEPEAHLELLICENMAKCVREINEEGKNENSAPAAT